jgi:hypothetical protein
MLWRVLLGMGPELPRHGEDHLIKCHVDRLLDMGRWRFAVLEVNGLDLPTRGSSRLKIMKYLLTLRGSADCFLVLLKLLLSAFRILRGILACRNVLTNCRL